MDSNDNVASKAEQDGGAPRAFDQTAGRARALLRPVRALRRIANWAEDSLRGPASEREIETDAQRFWSEPGERKGQMAHWRGAGVFSEDARWDAMGREHYELYERFARAEGKTELKRVIEWGCGGGANAVHFARGVTTFAGVDVSRDSLDECARQLERAGSGQTVFSPILIDTSAPERVLSAASGAYDLFLCTYVFELLPSRQYGVRILQIAAQLLEAGGLAIIQIKYEPNARVRKRPKYETDFANMTTYRIDEFWSETEQAGFVPRAVSLVPYQPLVQDRHYAYFLLRKP